VKRHDANREISTISICYSDLTHGVAKICPGSGQALPTGYARTLYLSFGRKVDSLDFMTLPAASTSPQERLIRGD
jgi:hypothetical protein